MVRRAAGRGSSDGVNRAILETGLGSTGTVLEAELPKVGRCRPDVRSAASGTGAIESRAAGAEEGFPRCRATGEAARVSGADLELCARYRTATVAHRDAQKVQLTRDRVQLQNRLESLLEETHIKLSSLVSDLLGLSARRMLQALADGETNPTSLAALADKKLRATPAQLCDALSACTELNPVYRRLLKMVLKELQFLEQQIVK